MIWKITRSLLGLFIPFLEAAYVRTGSIPVLRKAERILRNSVTLTPFSGCDCVRRVYDRLNADYDIIHKLCRFFLDNTGPTQDLGDRTMVPFLVDMARLFKEERS